MVRAVQGGLRCCGLVGARGAKSVLRACRFRALPVQCLQNNRV